MNLEQLKTQLEQYKWSTEDTQVYRLLTLSVDAIEKMGDKLGEEAEKIQLFA